jgi:hypothetical protein
MTMINKILSKFNSPDNGDGSCNEHHSTPKVPGSILAFRTITTLLAQLPRSTPIKAVDNLEDIEDLDDCQ